MSSLKPEDDPTISWKLPAHRAGVSRPQSGDRRKVASSKRWWGDVAPAVTLALRYVQAGVRSRQNVVTYLRRRGVAADSANRAVTALCTRGLLDDRTGARLWADHWARRGYARMAIRLKLAARGFDDEIVDHAIARLGISGDDEARAREVAARFGHARAGRSERTRAARTLAARGFDPDLIEQVLNESFDPLD